MSDAESDAGFCRRCGLNKRADTAGVLCVPPYAGLHDFPAATRVTPPEAGVS